MKKIVLILVVAVLGVTGSFAQHEIGPALSSQIFSRINYNPAGIGNNDKIQIFSQNRMQWLGFKGSPTTSVLNIHYFNEQLKSGIGGAFTFDKIGLGRQAINAKLAYAYNLDLSNKGLISFGLSGGVDMFQKDYSQDTWTDDYELLASESKMNPDFDFGVEYSTPHLLLGGSVNHIGMMGGPTSLSPAQTYYGYVRGAFDINKEWFLTPSLLYMNSSQTNVIDLSLVAFYEKNYWGGLSFRNMGNSNNFLPNMSILLGVEWNFLRVGYAYEFSLGETANVSSNTHELMLSFIIGKSDKSGAAPVGKGKSKGKSAPAKGKKKK